MGRKMAQGIHPSASTPVALGRAVLHHVWAVDGGAHMQFAMCPFPEWVLLGKENRVDQSGQEFVSKRRIIITAMCFMHHTMNLAHHRIGSL